jgi:hypothetical protein
MPEGKQNIMHDGTNIGKHPFLHEFGTFNTIFQHPISTERKFILALTLTPHLYFGGNVHGLKKEGKKLFLCPLSRTVYSF